jgi:short-subunit dehydrogenase
MKPHYTLITGASEGFGRALAMDCARRGMNLVLVALPGSGLQLLSDHLRGRFNVDVVSLEKDLCLEDSCHAVYREVKALGLSVNMLVNNAGIGSTGMFEEGSIGL